MNPKALAWVTVVSRLACSAAIVFAVVEIGLLAKDAQRRLDAAAPIAQGLALEAEQTMVNANGAIRDIQAIQTDTTRTEAEMAGLLNQSRKAMLTSAQVSDLVGRTTTLLDNANAATVKLSATVDSLKGIGPATADAITQLATDTHGTLDSSQKLMAAATADLTDPAIHGTLVATESAAQSTASTAKHLDAVTADVQKEADAFVAPVKGFFNHLKLFLREIAGPAASVATAIK